MEPRAASRELRDLRAGGIQHGAAAVCGPPSAVVCKSREPRAESGESRQGQGDSEIAT